MCRIALLQIDPSLTVWAVFASSVAASPLLVCEAMHKKLPPLIATNAFQRAYDLLKETYCRKPPIIQTAFLGWYIFVNQSRIIQFMLAGFLNIISIGIIFFPQHLKNLIPPLVILIVHYGLLQSIYVVYLFKKLLFPEVTEEISQMEVPRILALDDDDDVTPGDIELMQGPKASPFVTTDSAATPANPTSPTPDNIPSPEPGSAGSLHGSMVIMSEIDDSSQKLSSMWMGASQWSASNSPVLTFSTANPTSPTPDGIPAPIRPFSAHHGNNSLQMQEQATLHFSLHGSMVSMSEIDDSEDMADAFGGRLFDLFPDETFPLR
jgi:hypothetical protein